MACFLGLVTTCCTGIGTPPHLGQVQTERSRPIGPRSVSNQMTRRGPFPSHPFVSPAPLTNIRTFTKRSFPNEVSIQWLFPSVCKSPRLPDLVGETSQEQANKTRPASQSTPNTSFKFEISLGLMNAGFLSEIKQ